jgi:senataxin
MNVAMTRARSSLFILGHAPTLERSDENWRKIIHDARERSLLMEVLASTGFHKTFY